MLRCKWKVTFYIYKEFLPLHPPPNTHTHKNLLDDSSQWTDFTPLSLPDSGITPTAAFIYIDHFLFQHLSFLTYQMGISVLSHFIKLKWMFGDLYRQWLWVGCCGDECYLIWGAGGEGYTGTFKFLRLLSYFIQSLRLEISREID